MLSLSFDEVIKSKYHNKPIRLRCIITGKSLVPYHIPKRIKVKCLVAECSCDLKKEKVFDINAVDERVLMFIDVKTNAMTSIIKGVLGIKCKSLHYEIIDYQLVERIYIARPTGKERTKKGGGSRAAYIVGGTVETNTVYDLEGYTTKEPTTQNVTHVFTKAFKKSNDIESFKLSLQKHNELNEFCVSNPSDEKLYEKLYELYTSYAHNITKIYHRFDLHLCVDLIFRSAITFYFDNEFVHKGWMQAMIIGDTQCGKGYVAEKLVEYFGLGEVISGENASFSGLVGGLQQFNKHWVITWGKIPMNDCGLLVIDETSGLLEDIWGKLSRVRSEGIAEITKIHTEVANARTRLLFICNPIRKIISNYSHGIEAIAELIKTPEDIARFDYVLVVEHKEVSGEDINKHRYSEVPEMYNSKLEQDLILWCWSRKPEDIVFTDKAIKKIYKYSLELGKMFDFSIPLIQVENVRFKIAKVAIAFAARFYSNKDNGKKLLVTSVHVDCAFVFFRLIYEKESSGYLAYSKVRQSSYEMMTPEKMKELEKYFDKWKLQKNELLRHLLINNNISPEDICVHMGVDRTVGIEVVSVLLKSGCLTRKYGGYYKTPDFNAWLKIKVLGPPIGYGTTL